MKLPSLAVDDRTVASRANFLAQILPAFGIGFRFVAGVFSQEAKYAHDDGERNKEDDPDSKPDVGMTPEPLHDGSNYS